MKVTDVDVVLGRRLANQRLGTTRLLSPEAVVQWSGAVQAQDYAGAAWGLALRADGCGMADVDQALADGRILRTHVLRPTWHFVTPADIRWLLTLTAPRIRATTASYIRQAGLDARTIARAHRVLARELHGRARTRHALATTLRKAGIDVAGFPLGVVLMLAELDQVICSGPREGNHSTYTLLDARASSTTIAGDAALAALGGRYLASHGPATVRDFAWWSGLTMRDARRAFELAVPSPQRLEVNGLEYWAVSTGDRPVTLRGTNAWLLPNYDEFLIAYKDRGLVRAGARDGVSRVPAASPHHLIVNGRLAGSWRRSVARPRVILEVQTDAPLPRAVARAIAGAAQAYGTFLDRPVDLTIR